MADHEPAAAGSLTPSEPVDPRPAWQCDPPEPGFIEFEPSRGRPCGAPRQPGWDPRPAWQCDPPEPGFMSFRQSPAATQSVSGTRFGPATGVAVQWPEPGFMSFRESPAATRSVSGTRFGPATGVAVQCARTWFHEFRKAAGGHAERLGKPVRDPRPAWQCDAPEPGSVSSGEPPAATRSVSGTRFGPATGVAVRCARTWLHELRTVAAATPTRAIQIFQGDYAATTSATTPGRPQTHARTKNVSSSSCCPAPRAARGERTARAVRRRSSRRRRAPRSRPEAIPWRRLARPGHASR